MIRPKPWNGNALKGAWQVTRKLDGVRALWTPNGYVSRNGKPLYNLEHFHSNKIMDMEVFMGDFDTTVSAVRTTTPVSIPYDALYQLLPLDPRLEGGIVDNPSAEWITNTLEVYVQRGDEGLVMRQGSSWVKVKKAETHDVKVVGVVEGVGKCTGMLGAFITARGNVGTGLTDKQRKEFWSTNMVGQIIEVECMELTKDGRFRLPRFKRHRFDK